MTSREQKIWDTVHAWAKHQNHSIPDDNLRGLMDDVLGVVESEVDYERRRVWGRLKPVLIDMINVFWLEAVIFEEQLPNDKAKQK